MRRNIAHAITIVALGVATGCATGTVLTAKGMRVEYVSQVDMPVGCSLVADVPIGIAPDGARAHSTEELQTLMRNKAGEQGGTHVVLDFSEQRGDASDPYFVGRGRSYRCPPPEPEHRHTSAPAAHPPAEGDGAGTTEEPAEEPPPI